MIRPSETVRHKIATILTLCSALAGASFGQIIREPNSTLKFPTNPQNFGSYRLTNAVPGLNFDKPVAVAAPPGETNRLYVVERYGRIMLIPDLTRPTASVFLDIRDRVHASSWEGTSIENRRTEGLAGLAFHPDFATNGRFFVCYSTITTTSQGEGHHNRVAEYYSPDGLTADADSEIQYITQLDEGYGHNINDIHFGPDGYLYLAIGDEGDGGYGDDFQNAQRIDKDFFSGILRIDVDNRPENLDPLPHPASHGNYKIPVDNPFVGATNFAGRPVDPAALREEFFAVGLRNPWRFSFDPLTQEIYAGDVGQHGREEINHIFRGGNYGWSFFEGTKRGPKAELPAGVEFVPPLWEYVPGSDSFSGYSVTGGVVYRGNRLPELFGNLIFADFVSGNVWGLNVDHVPAALPQRLLTQRDIAGFGYDPRNQDILLINHASGELLTIEFMGSNTIFPARLSAAGIFKDLNSLKPEAGIHPFDVNVPFWSDGAIKSRWFSLPDTTKQFGFNAESNWVLPTGAIWIKHFEVETRIGDPGSRKPVETRVLVRTGTNSGYGLSYKWNEAGTDADLVGLNGDTRTITVSDAAGARQQVWKFPGRQECLQCHTEAGGFALGFNTAQLNGDATHGNLTTNQIAALADAGYLANAPEGIHGLRALAPLDDETVSRTYRAKSYFAANCSFCHQPGGTAEANALWDASITTPLSQADIIWGPLFNSSDSEMKVVTPGKPERSAIVQRIGTLGRGRMPPIGSTVIDHDALQLLSEWVVQDAPGYESYSQWSKRVFAGLQTRTEASADADGDGISNYAEYLAGSNPMLTGSLPITITAKDGEVTLSFLHPANRAMLLESVSALGDPWTLLQASGNRMHFPAVPLSDRVTGRPQGSRIYRLRILEP